MQEPLNPGIPESVYITTSIPYVNARPHVGHALEEIQADVFARHQSMLGNDVRLQMGTDENSLKNVQAAEQQGISTAALVAGNAVQFEKLPAVLGVACDNFVRTSADSYHSAGVHKIWQICSERGDIYKRPYAGLYCIGCEQFYSEGELVDGRCPVHDTKPESVEEENYFFRLSRYADQLIRLIESSELRIIPDSRRNEVLSFMRRGLEDFSISRSQTRARGWGIPVADDSSQVIYVWFDALTNYISGLGYAEEGPLFEQYWLSSASRIHVIGKDITRFHAVYWPAMLLSAGLPLPTTIFIHGFITVDGRKMSKSRGNVTDPEEYVKRYGRDALRYYLLRKIPATGDGNFSRDEFEQTYRSDLADQLGNLLNRVVNMIQRYTDGEIALPGQYEALEHNMVQTAEISRQEIHDAMASFDPAKALAAIWKLIGAANKYTIEVAPWVLAKERLAEGEGAEEAAARLATALYVLAEALRLIAQYLAPFLPDTADAIARQLGIDLIRDQGWRHALQWGQLPAGTRVASHTVLFPKQAVLAERVSGVVSREGTGSAAADQQVAVR